jgi:hypothetical protein
MAPFSSAHFECKTKLVFTFWKIKLAEKFLVCLVKVASEFDMGIEGVWFAMEICFWVVWDTLCEVC